jgi:hypothetical protein
VIKEYNGAGVERGVAASSHVKTGEASLHTSGREEFQESSQPNFVNPKVIVKWNQPITM